MDYKPGHYRRHVKTDHAERAARNRFPISQGTMQLARSEERRLNKIDLLP